MLKIAIIVGSTRPGRNGEGLERVMRALRTKAGELQRLAA